MSDLRDEFRKFIEKIQIPEDLSLKDESKIVSEIFQYSKNITPKNLFRYRESSDRNINAFENDLIYLTKPTRFNDPYDSLIYINRQILEEEINKVVNVQDFNRMERLIQDENFRKEEEKKLGVDFIREMISNYIASGSPKSFSKASLENLKNQYLLILDSIISQSIKALKQSSLVGSFSENVDSILMWSHYARNHSGFVLNYNFKSLYSIDTPIKNVKATYFADKKLFPVIYSNDRMDATEYAEFHFIDEFLKRTGINITQPFYDKLFYYKILLYKSLDWEYEKEWRIIKQTNIDFTDNKSDFEILENIIPQEIYFGTHIDNDKKEKLIKLADKKGIRKYQMAIEHYEKSYRLNYIELK
jgi:hypothetical protein